MEVCGTHTVSISRNGIRSIIPENIKLISGPGCPVCVTPTDAIDKAIALSGIKDVIIATFGDMVRVPGSSSSLEKQKSKGATIEIVYSPLDSLEIARKNPNKEIIFIGVGFETTSPTIAATVLEAEKQQINNFSVLCEFKLIPPALKALIAADDVEIDAFILPGHVSTIIGTKPYEFLTCPSVITGFLGEDILEAIGMIMDMIGDKGGAYCNTPVRENIRIQYKRVVKPEGNSDALHLLYEVFESCDANWRGIGNIPESGMRFKKKYEKFDAEKKFKIEEGASCSASGGTPVPDGCSCGDILKGKMIPTECKLFGKRCKPEDPVGPCMVSSEGACSAYYRYGESKRR